MRTAPSRRRVLASGTIVALSGCLGDVRDALTGSSDGGENVEIQSDDLVVDVVGMRYSWVFRFEERGVEARSELVLPVDRPVVFRTNSEDVDHDLAFTERDEGIPVGPDETLTRRLTFEETTEESIDCGVNCGPGTDRHVGTLRIVSESDYESWLRERAESA